MSENGSAIPARDDNDDTDNGAAPLWRAVSLFLWFALVIVAFWGPSLGLLLPLTGLFTALYGVFLLVIVATTILDLLRRREQERLARHGR